MAVAYRDYYKTLGVPKTATDKEIKAAYRKLARKFHPDMNPGNKQAEARFKEINEANEVLSDPDKRRRYDTLGENWQGFPPPQAAGSRTQRVNINIPPEDLGGFSEFFRTIFGQGGFGGGGFEGFEPAEGPADSEIALELTLEQVLKGTSRTLEVANGGSPRKVEVKIPAGVRDGSRVRVSGEGRKVGNRRGDLYLRVHIAPHPAFKTQGDDLETTLVVPLSTAVLGGEASVPTLEGNLGIKVPAGTPVGRVFRLRGHGLPRLERGGGRGDILATLAVQIPQTLTKRERELFEELRSAGR
jgi:DnaJ-class molecular chaperone